MAEAVFVKTLKGKTITLYMKAPDAIAYMFEKLEEMGESDAERCQLAFHGQQIQGESALSDYSIPKEPTLHLVVTRRGEAGNKMARTATTLM